MSTAIHGTDLSARVGREGFRPRGLLEGVTKVWPGAWVEPAGEGGARPAAHVLADPTVPLPTEFFVYKDRTAAESWERDGWTEAHGNDMVHVLVTPAAEPDALLLTVVVDSITGELYGLLRELDEAIGRMSAGGSDGRPLDWEAELHAAGLAGGPDRFYETVGQSHTRLYPNGTPDDLMCHPTRAIHFCEEVRRQVGAGVPDHLVMKALVVLWKREAGEPTLRPRLSRAHG